MGQIENPGSDLENEMGVTASRRAQVSVVGRRLTKAEREAQGQEKDLLRSKALTVEDVGFDQLSVSVREMIAKPTYDPVQLSVLVQQNNTLLQCVDAMKVNIDGTGYTIERLDGKPVKEGDAEDPAEVKRLKQFFDEPFPGESFVTQRRALREDRENTGNAYLEVIRNAKGEIVFTRRLDAKLTRMLRLDDPVVVERKIDRNGTQQTLKMLMRERRYAMVVGTQVVYFREFGASRPLNCKTGKWQQQGEPDIPANELATEVIHFRKVPDVVTEYGVPCWINQIPSVLGSRKAEEFNLEYFNAGGLPPAMIMVQGGQLSSDSKKALTAYLAGNAKLKQRAVIAEVFPATGDIGSAGAVKVTVERFGNEQQKDSMFQNYDVRCADHVRGAFRLPPLFLGLTKDHNYATAYASYVVAEAQVFKPERDEFDEIINVKIVREFSKDYVYRSIPLTVNDIEQKVKAITAVKDVVTPESLVDAINEIGGLRLQVKDQSALEALEMGLLEGKVAATNASVEATQASTEMMRGGPGKPAKDQKGAKNAKMQGGKPQGGRIAKMDDEILTVLASDWAKHLSGDYTFSEDAVATMQQLIKTLTPTVRALFNRYVGACVANPVHDAPGVTELLACVGECGHAHA